MTCRLEDIAMDVLQQHFRGGLISLFNELLSTDITQGPGSTFGIKVPWYYVERACGGDASTPVSRLLLVPVASPCFFVGDKARKASFGVGCLLEI